MESTEKRPCPVCNHTEYTHFADENILEEEITEFSYASRKLPEFMCLELVCCAKCELVYAPKLPDLSFLEKAYTDASFDSSQEAIHAANTYIKILKPHFSSMETKQAAVDVGAGSGPLLPLLVDAGFTPVRGVEPSSAAIQAAPEDVQAMLIEGMFTKAMLAEFKVSLICSFMTLEHITHPSEFIADAFGSLEDGGKVAVVVHNWAGGLNKFLGLKSPIIDVEHLQLYNPTSIKRLLEEHGFKDVQVESFSNSYPITYWARLLPLPSSLKLLVIKVLGWIGFGKIMVSLPVGNLLAVGTKSK